MSTKVYFINSPDAEYSDEEFAWFQSLILTEGIIGDKSTGAMGLAVTQNGTPDMSVLVSAGKALVEITVSGRTFNVVFENSAQVQKTIAANSTGSNRVDAVIIRIDKDTDANSLKNNIGTIEVVTGSGTTALTDGAINTAVGSDGWYRLANVTVANGDSSIITAEISDTRSKVTYSKGVAFANTRITSEASSATPTINTAITDIHRITALATNITSMSTNLSGSPDLWQMLAVEITGTATRTIAWGASFVDGGIYALPTTTSGTVPLIVLLRWNGSHWECIGVA